MIPRLGERLRTCAIGLTAALASLGPAHAQIVFDGSLGAPGSLTGSNVSILANRGQQVGGNLFHSFSQFNVLTNQTATFQGDSSVTNIIGRVTGGSPSSIDGTIAMGSGITSANLYLINPSGLVFGQNAFLDLKGSFHASTADYLKLGGTGTFRATTNAAQSTLSSAPPSAFGFLAASPAAIQVNDSFLAVPTGQSLSLVGGNVSITGSTFGAFLAAQGGRINVASAAGPGEISLAASGISTSPSQVLGQVNISDALLLTGSGNTGLSSGPVYILGGNIVLSDETLIGGANKASSAGGSVSLHATGTVRIIDSFLDGSSDGVGKGGGVSITANQAEIRGSAVVSTAAAASGDAGDITFNVGRMEVRAGGFVTAGTLSASSGAAGVISATASDAIVIDGTGGGVPSALSTLSAGSGHGGDIRLQAPLVALTNGGAALGAAVSSSVGGNISIDADRVLLSGGILGSPATGANGTSGNITINARESVFIQDVPGHFALVHAFTNGSGNAGNISITAPLVRMDGGHISSATTTSGNGGTIRLDAGRIEILSGGFIDATTSGQGAGGSVALAATESVLLQGKDAAGLRSAVIASSDGQGRAGNISVSGPLVTLNGGVLASPASSTGNAGAITVNAGRLEILDGGSINNQTFAGSSGAGGSVQVTASSIKLDGGRISVQSLGTGNAGSIVIDAGQKLELSNGSSITTEAASADGGDIHITARDLVSLFDSRITTSVGTGSGNGGNIRIDPTFVVLKNSQITANAFGGNGGNIDIVSDFFLTDTASVVQASSQLGISGTVAIAAPQTNLSSSVTVLPSAFFDASALIRQSCATRAERAASSLVYVGRGGLAANPEQAGYADYGWRASRAAGYPASNFRIAGWGCNGG